MDINRRKFLKIILVGSGAFFADKIFGPLFSKFLNEPVIKSDRSAFKVKENKKVLSVYDSSGAEILQIDKGV